MALIRSIGFDLARRTVVLTALVVAVTAVVGVAPNAAQAATTNVAMGDNFFNPAEIHIRPGDTVVWNYGGRNTHTVTSDDPGGFDSGDMTPSGKRTFSRSFDKAGTYPYFCRYHGARGGVGMSGVVIVGEPEAPRPEPKPGDGRRSRLIVPTEFRTIQRAVDAAEPGSTVLIRPGRYRESVVVRTRGIVIKGVDRFRTVLHGDDSRQSGIVVEGVRNVEIKNLTVRNYLDNGILFNGVRVYLAARIDSIKNRARGISAVGSYEGVIRNSFAWGSGESGFSVSNCLACSTLIDDVRSEMNYLGYSGSNATGVVVRDSTFARNGAGIVPNTVSEGGNAPNRGTTIVKNLVVGNNYENVPAAGLSATTGIPFGTGIWLWGVRNNVAINNVIRDHERYGVLISQSMDEESPPINNSVRLNVIRGAGRYDLAYDGTGYDNCFYGNDLSGPTGPPDAQTLYSCPNRPNVGVPFAPVQADVAESSSNWQTREQIEPPEPQRPRCQRGAPGCKR